MLLGIAFLIGATLFGTGLVRRLPPLRRWLNHIEQATWGMVVGWMLTTIGAYLVARVLGRLSFGPTLGFTFVVWLSAAALWIRTLRRIQREGLAMRTLWRAEYAGLAFVVALFAPIYVRLFSSHLIEPGGAGVYSGGSARYDLPFHLTLITSFLHGHNFPPLYTPFPPASLLYPFLPDFQISVLATLGMTLRPALLLASIPLALSVTVLFYSFARRFLSLSTKSSGPFRAQVSAALATIIFLFNGGFGFYYFWRDWRRSGNNLTAFLSQLETNYTNLGEHRIQWTNFIADTLLPQRASLFGFPIALMVLTLFAIAWRNWSLDENQRNRWCGVGLLLIAGTLTGLTPLFHAHVYLGLGLISGFLFLLQPRRQWLAYWLPAVLLALPHLLTLVGHVSANSFMRFQPGWRAHTESVWIWYLLKNIGAPLLLIIPAWWAAPPLWRRFYLAFLFLLSFSLLIAVSPNDFDNIKLMYLWYAPTSVLIGAWLVRLASVDRWKLPARVLATALTIVCIASGLLALQHERVSHHLIFSHEEMAAAASARETTQPRALFLTAPTLFQPILSLAGQPVLRANTDWLWSHGYEFGQREADVKSIYAGSDEALSLIQYYGIDYVYFGPRELEAGGNQSFFDDNMTAIYRSGTIVIYDANSLRIQENGRLRPAQAGPREFASRLDRDPYQSLVEFPRVGFAVHSFYRAALGRPPRYQEFMDDLSILGRGLFVGLPGWEETLERNKVSLAEKWSQRADFKARYDGKSAESYVDELINNAGAHQSREERQAVITALANNSESLAAVLNRYAEAARNTRRDYNAAYLLAHYFGYLRRNPEDPPDNNFVGFNYWLADLNRTGDYRSLTRVFIESDEYRHKSRQPEQTAGR
ncbi:MAG TPA: hypothetical protein VNO50_16360 [Pyrinomonadaceae bacterium]|nr:hypothetical protein [Pyrinomonadaceae bacterium]